MGLIACIVRILCGFMDAVRDFVTEIGFCFGSLLFWARTIILFIVSGEVKAGMCPLLVSSGDFKVRCHMCNCKG